jgi:thiamine biosynthesis lipoprotein
MRLHRLPFRAMASPCELHVYSDDADKAERALAAAKAEVLRIEAKYSRYRDDSVVAAINASAGDSRGIEVDAETAALLDYAAAAHTQSGGMFDISSGVLRRAWDFRSGRLPEAEDVARLLSLVGWQRVSWSSPLLCLPVAGMQLDFGGFGKEYAVDRAVAVLAAHEIAHGMVDLGGDVRAVGPHPDGRPWRVGIAHPQRPAEAIACIDLHHGAVATSGDYERAFIHDGKRYSHLLDPRSGWPVSGGPASVSVLAQQCLIAGTASSVAMLHAVDAPAWLDALGLPWLSVTHQGALAGSVATTAPEAIVVP